ncbi:unnamed protein product [Spirodela intermedia]|uniref:EamA domain-containing protein n=1 Tax=Spirodela intermedia TaxID=51605 RepID=A0A7I8LAH1_SPIIN|nr:unnamed protein product [Spirodela intermedia]
MVEPNGREEAAPAAIVAVTVADAEEQISPLLPDVQGGRKMSIFSVSDPNTRRRLPKESILGDNETEVTFFLQLIFWMWSGSRYSGLLCIASSSAIYCIMEVFTDTFSGRSIPLLEVVFVRCTILSILSLLWVKSAGKTVFETRKTRNLLLLRALTGCLSLICFIYSMQNLPLSYAVVVNFSTPLMASIAARIILQEKLGVIDIGGLLCGFMGLLITFQEKRFMLGELSENAGLTTSGGGHHIYPVLGGMLSSAAAGISYCLIRAATKSSDQPVSSVLAFGVLASSVSAICIFCFQEFVVPDLLTFFLMVILGVLAFFAEVFLARGLQLEKISKATTIQYLKVLLSQMWAISLSRSSPSFSRSVGLVFIFASGCIILCSKRTERETEMGS